MIVRQLDRGDAEACRKLCLQLDRETPYRLYGPGERLDVLRVYADEIAAIVRNPRSCLIAAVEDGKLVGYLAAYGHAAPRVAHVVTVSVAILKSYTGRGIGRCLFENLEAWAQEIGVRRIELTVMTDNEPALKLYTRLGFCIEGRKRASMRFGDRYVDEFYMSKLLVPEARP